MTRFYSHINQKAITVGTVFTSAAATGVVSSLASGKPFVGLAAAIAELTAIAGITRSIAHIADARLDYGEPRRPNESSDVDAVSKHSEQPSPQIRMGYWPRG
jgi:hypothetical protein